jgi:hypothetical protein
MNEKKLGLVLVLSLSIFIGSIYAKTIKGINVKDTIKVENDTLILNGMALRKKFFFKVYIAALYIPTRKKNAEKILENDTKRVAIMHFMRSVSSSKINTAWYEGLKNNTPKCSTELKKQFETLASYMNDVKSGDRIEFIYIPNIGTEVIVKKKKKGIIKGKAFSDALLSCWIGNKPGPGNKFKNNILGK